MSRTLTKEDDPGMVEVRREDQQRINKFSACNRQMQELSDEEKTLKEDLQNLQDATDELLLADDDEMVNLKLGECYVLLQKEEAEETLERKIEECEEKLGSVEEQVGELKDVMAGLKVELYGRFGKSINLDE